MKYEDDLMYASEAIQKIASEAMQRVENLYKLRFSLPRDPELRDPEPAPTRTTPNVRSESVTESIPVPENVETSFDLVDNFMHNIPKSKPTVKPNLKPVSVSTSIDQRPEKIDSNLHGLTL